jgi:hypothetical protein
MDNQEHEVRLQNEEITNVDMVDDDETEEVEKEYYVNIEYTARAFAVVWASNFEEACKLAERRDTWNVSEDMRSKQCDITTIYVSDHTNNTYRVSDKGTMYGAWMDEDGELV